MQSGGGQKRHYDNESKGILIEPENGKALNSLVFLHGLGDSAEGLADIFFDNPQNPVGKSTRVVLLTAPTVPVTVNGGSESTSWFDIKDINWNEDSICQVEVANNTKTISAAIEKEIEYHGRDASKVFIGGFSQGCCMSLHVGFSYPKKIGGIVGLSGLLFPFSKVDQIIPAVLIHGKADFIVPYAITELSYQRVVGKPSIEWYPISGLGHSINGTSIARFREFWAKHAHK